MATRSMSSFGDTLDSTTAREGQSANQVADLGHNTSNGQSSVKQDRMTSEHIVPPIPPRSPDREQHPYREM